MLSSACRFYCTRVDNKIYMWPFFIRRIGMVVLCDFSSHCIVLVVLNVVDHELLLLFVIDFIEAIIKYLLKSTKLFNLKNKFTKNVYRI